MSSDGSETTGIERPSIRALAGRQRLTVSTAVTLQVKTAPLGGTTYLKKVNN